MELVFINDSQISERNGADMILALKKRKISSLMIVVVIFSFQLHPEIYQSLSLMKSTI